MKPSSQGWDWFGHDEPAVSDRYDPITDDDELTALAARCFKGRDGDRLLSHLRSLTLERALGPKADDAVLRHTEGQRQLVAYLSTLVERGRAPRISI